MRFVRILLIIIAVVCFGVALSYPIRYRLAQDKNNSNMEELSAMRSRVQQEDSDDGAERGSDMPTDTGAAGDSSFEDEGTRIDDGAAGNAAPDAPSATAVTETDVRESVQTDAAPATQAQASEDATPDAIPAPEADAGGDAVSDTTPATQAQASEDAAPDTAPAPEANAGGDAVSDTTPATQAQASEDAAPDAAPAPDANAGGDAVSGTAPATQADARENAGTGVSPGVDVNGTNEATQSGQSANPDADGAASTEAVAPRATPRRQTPEELAAMDEAEPWVAPSRPTVAPTSEPTPEPVPTPTPEPTEEPLPEVWWDLTRYEFLRPTPTPGPIDEATPTPGPTPVPTPTRDRMAYTGALPYSMKEKVVLDKDAILPELKEIYERNNDLAGWITIPDTVIDYPVVQTQDSEFYLTHDFYGEENVNGQIILDAPCDPYTPSYNLVISGHHMKNGSMFGGLPEYRIQRYWENHKFLEFDTLMERKQYVVFAAFYSADYDEDEEGFRYNANIEYKKDAEQWLSEVHENQLYDTGVDAEFGDEFITLTTCNRARHRNGRFVVVCRKIREGEIFE